MHGDTHEKFVSRRTAGPDGALCALQIFDEKRGKDTPFFRGCFVFPFLDTFRHFSLGNKKRKTLKLGRILESAFEVKEGTLF